MRPQVHISRRAGFTMVEVLVSIGIIGLLLALLLPAIQSVRESSRRTTCRSNLKQVVLAALQYETTFRVYPNTRWSEQLLPHVEWSGGELQPPIFFCPSDPLVTRRITLGTNFDINTGVALLQTGFTVPSGDITYKKPADMTDGTSHTAAFSERLVWPDWAPLAVASGTHIEVWPRRILRIGQLTSDLDEFANECEFYALAPAAYWIGYSGYTHNLPPNRNSCVNGPDNMYTAVAVTTRSFHWGGVNTAYADGSVRVTPDSIDPKVWQALGTRQGNETVSDL